VGDLEAKLERFALDPPIAPARVLPAEAKDQLPQLRIAGTAWTWRTLAKGAPLAADQIAVPAEQGLRTGQQANQLDRGEEPTEGGEYETIARLPGWLAELPLEDAELMAQHKHLSSELRLGAVADEENVSEEANERISKAQEHGADPADWPQPTAGEAAASRFRVYAAALTRRQPN
jgi:hypothetical protein